MDYLKVGEKHDFGRSQQALTIWLICTTHVSSFVITHIKKLCELFMLHTYDYINNQSQLLNQMQTFVHHLY